jgi:hypothetical protein
MVHERWWLGCSAMTKVARESGRMNVVIRQKPSIRAPRTVLFLNGTLINMQLWRERESDENVIKF